MAPPDTGQSERFVVEGMPPPWELVKFIDFRGRWIDATYMDISIACHMGMCCSALLPDRSLHSPCYFVEDYHHAIPGR